MITTRHPVNFPYTRQELEALFRYANEHDVEQGRRYDARSAAINLWSHHWAHPATREESEIVGSFYVHWAPTPRLYEIEIDEGFSLEGLLQELGRLELKALGRVKHGDVPQEGRTPCANTMTIFMPGPKPRPRRSARAPGAMWTGSMWRRRSRISARAMAIT